MAVGHWAKGYLGDAGDGPAMNDIEGLDIQNPQDGQTIVYDAASGTWKNGEGSGGGGGGGTGIFWVNGEFQEDDSLTLDKTYSEIKSAIDSGKMVALKTAAYEDASLNIALYYLQYYSEDTVTFRGIPTVTSDAVTNTDIIIDDNNSVAVIATSMEAPDPEG